MKFFMDLAAVPGERTGSNSTDHPDIKVPWELSRFHQLVVLGLAYRQTGDAVYARDFNAQVESWWVANPYLLGVNWVCPMDVALRAVNLIWAATLFRQAPEITPAFWQQVVCSLYDHARYLEKTWEVSDKPNNHYLADLVGYLYLAGFFYELPYFKKQFAKILAIFVAQVGQQIHPDGSSYEGSTAYHRLDTEMVAHVLALCEAFAVPVPVSLPAVFEKMVAFVQDCSDAAGTLIKIGDDDSSKVVTGFVVPGRAHVLKGELAVTYPQAGITIMKTGAWHLTYRHPTYDRRQPTGHFHHDELAVTLSLAGRLVFGDPGSYCYTPCIFWRDYFRSPAAHNTFFIGEFEQNSTDLFVLDRRPMVGARQVTCTHASVKVADRHARYAGHGVTAGRNIFFDGGHDCLTILDWVTGTPDRLARPVTWTLHGAPDIFFNQDPTTKTWTILYQQEPVAQLTSTLPLTCRSDFYAPEYGVVVPTQTLTAVVPWATGQHETVILKVNGYEE